MADHDSSNSSAPAASKPKKNRNKITPEQRIARLEQQLARAKSEQQQKSRKLKTRGKIILGAAFMRFVDGLAADRQQKTVQSLWALVSERDQKVLIDSGLLPEQAIPPDSTDGVKIHPSGSDAEKTGNYA